MRCVDCLPLIEEFFDGETDGRTAERMSAHLSACEDCSAALDALSFEQEVYARYDRGLEVTPALWARVSAEIEREPLPESRTERRPFLNRVGAAAAAVLSTLAARPALASSFALLLLGVTAGSLWLARVRPSVPDGVAVNVPRDAAAPAAAPSPSDSNDGGGGLKAQPSETQPSEVQPAAEPVRYEGARAVESEANAGARARDVRRERAAPEDVEGLLAYAGASSQTDAGIVKLKYDAHEARAEDSPVYVKIAGSDAGVVTTSAQLLDPSQKEVARHVEQAQMLLRSIKNARAEGGDTFNVAYEKKLSRRLLNDNVTLQLDAETRGDKDTQQVLDRIEPYLLDIANMPEKASREEVRSIRERIDRKEIIAALQVY